MGEKGEQYQAPVSVEWRIPMMKDLVFYKRLLKPLFDYWQRPVIRAPFLFFCSSPSGFSIGQPASVLKARKKGFNESMYIIFYLSIDLYLKCSNPTSLWGRLASPGAWRPGPRIKKIGCCRGSLQSQMNSWAFSIARMSLLLVTLCVMILPVVPPISLPYVSVLKCL